MSFETGLQAFKQNKFESAIDALLVYCKECDAAEKVTSQKYMQAHIGIVKSYQALKQWEQAIAHCQTLTDSQNHPLTIWVDRTLPKLKKAAEKGDQPDAADPQEAKPKQDDNIMLLQQGMAAYKKMQCDRAIQLLEEYVNASTNSQSRTYMQAQMTLVKAYKETKQISQAIARCEELSTSENFALKSWAGKLLPKLKQERGPENSTESPAPSPDATPSTASNAPNNSPSSPPSTTATSTATSTTTKTSGDIPDSLAAAMVSPPKRMSTKRQLQQPPSSPSRAAKTPSRSRPAKRQKPSAKSSPRLVKNSIAHNGIGMVGGAFAGALGGFFKRFILRQIIRFGFGIAIGIIILIYRIFTGSNFDLPPLQTAVMDGNLETVQKIVKKQKTLDETDDFGNTALFYAFTGDCSEDDLCPMNSTQTKIAELLLDSGASVTVTNTWQETPLHIAVQAPNTVDVLKIIVSKGANVNAVNEFQVTPLHMAAGAVTPKNVEFLIANGANVNSKDAEGYTPLDYVEDMAFEGYPMAKDVVALLKRNGGRSSL